MRIWLLVFALLCACPGRQASPESSVRAFADALDEGRFEAAYRQLGAAYRMRVPFVEFERHLRQHPEEVRALIGMMAHVAETEEVTARVPFPDGDALELVREDGRWRVVGNAVDFYDQSTPRATLRSFVRAMERRRYDVVLRFVPEADREGMSEEHMGQAWEGDAREEIDRLVANLRANLDRPIEVVGDRATMTYGDSFTVQFLREDDVWKIEDPD